MEKNKVAIITGASQGIGKTVALGLAEDGYNVALIARSKTKLQQLANKIKTATKQKALIFPLDITDSAAIKTAIKEIINKWQRVDVLFNSAGIYAPGTLELDLTEYQRLFDVNVKAQIAFIQHIVPIMKKQKQGFILNVASTAGKTGFAERGGYVSSKFALVGLTHSLHRELAEFNIKVTAICPGYVATKMAKNAGSELPTKEMIQPEDIVATVRWLLNLSPATYVKDILMDCQEYTAFF